MSDIISLEAYFLATGSRHCKLRWFENKLRALQSPSLRLQISGAMTTQGQTRFFLDTHIVHIDLSIFFWKRKEIIKLHTMGNVLYCLNRAFSKAGGRRWLGIRPTVPGVAMDPVDHVRYCVCVPLHMFLVSHKCWEIVFQSSYFLFFLQVHIYRTTKLA